MHTEALTHMAMIFHNKIIMRLGAEASGRIPANCKLTPCHQDLYLMWDFLNICCTLGKLIKVLILNE